MMAWYAVGFYNLVRGPVQVHEVSYLFPLGVTDEPPLGVIRCHFHPKMNKVRCL